MFLRAHVVGFAVVLSPKISASFSATCRSSVFRSTLVNHQTRPARIRQNFDTIFVRLDMSFPIDFAQEVFKMLLKFYRTAARCIKLAVLWSPALALFPIWYLHLSWSGSNRSKWWTRILVWTIEKSGPCFLKVPSVR
jgi:hypothetical protein